MMPSDHQDNSKKYSGSLNSNKYVPEIGLVITAMDSSGPDLCCNLSNLSEESTMYLMLRGFTALMSGTEYGDAGPGKVRGIIEVPMSNHFALAFDLVVAGREQDDKRLERSTLTIIFLIFSEQDMKFQRKYYEIIDETLRIYTQPLTHIDDLTDVTFKRIKGKLISAVHDAIVNETKSTDEIKITLFDISTLVTLPKLQNHIARLILEADEQGLDGVTSHEIIDRLNETEYHVERALESLMRKGLVTIREIEECQYYAAIKLPGDK